MLTSDTKLNDSEWCWTFMQSMMLNDAECIFDNPSNRLPFHWLPATLLNLIQHLQAASRAPKVLQISWWVERLLSLAASSLKVALNWNHTVWKSNSPMFRMAAFAMHLHLLSVACFHGLVELLRSDSIHPDSSNLPQHCSQKVPQTVLSFGCEAWHKAWHKGTLRQRIILQLRWLHVT